MYTHFIYTSISGNYETPHNIDSHTSWLTTMVRNDSEVTIELLGVCSSI